MKRVGAMMKSIFYLVAVTAKLQVACELANLRTCELVERLQVSILYVPDKVVN